MKANEYIEKMEINWPQKCQNKECGTHSFLGLAAKAEKRPNGLVLCDHCFHEINPKELVV